MRQLVCFVLCLLTATAAAQSIAWYPCTVYSTSSTLFDQSESRHAPHFPAPWLSPLAQRPALFSASSSVSSSNLSNLTAQCANITAPLDYAGAAPGQTITFFIKRVRFASATAPSRAALWLLDGGPGASGKGMEALIEPLMSQLGTDYELILPDHRGVGRSTSFFCPDGTSVISPACIAYLKQYHSDTLPYFTTSNAAGDVGYTIQLLQKESPSTAAFVCGVSYGSYWANRFLVMYPTLAAAVILDGVCPPDLCRLIPTYDINSNIVGAQLMQVCGADPVCAAHLGVQPNDLISRTFQLLSAGALPCAAKVGLTSTVLQKLLGGLLFGESTRGLVAPLIHRLLRCADVDVPALQNVMVFATAQIQPLNDSVLFNGILEANVLFGELYSSDPTAVYTADYLRGLNSALFFSIDVSANKAPFRDSWPTYPTDKYYNQYPTGETPVLLLQGTQDGQTNMNWAQHAFDRIPNPAQLVIIPYAPHGTIFVSTTKDGGIACGAQVLVSYVLSGGRSVDTSCTQRMALPDVACVGNATLASSQIVFGTTDAWGEHSHQ